VLSRKAASMQAGLVTKGKAKPSSVEEDTRAVPEAEEKIIPITVRLKESMYRELIAYGSKQAPRIPNQKIMVQALKEFLEQHENDDSAA
jgi:hypothetical protein